MRWDTVLLDLDGTLSESGPAITASAAVAIAEVGAPVPDVAGLRSFVGPPIQDSFAALPGFDAARVAEAVAAYRRHYTATGMLTAPVYAGVHELLSGLRAAGLRLALATSKPEPYAEQVVAAAGLTPLLDVVAGSGLDGSRGSKAAVIGHALDRLGHPGRAVMVGDRWHDVAGAAEHGLPCLGVLWGYGSADELRDAGAVGLVATPADLLRTLTEQRAA
jgi:phosphoglycolate phosphatase